MLQFPLFTRFFARSLASFYVKVPRQSIWKRSNEIVQESLAIQIFNEIISVMLYNG